ncbi:MAG: hypothetical protein NXI18_08985 [Alphaproteobacteria bacterium]|nr:hypothetical protein [Alphaproteobacteria bacterium]
MTSSNQSALAEHRGSLSANLSSIDSIWTSPWGELADFKVFEGCIVADDVWVIPTSMVSEANHVANRRTVDFKKALPSEWRRDDSRAENLIRRLKRIAFLDFTQTVPGTRWRLKPPQAKVWVQHTDLLIRAARDASVLTGRSLIKSSTCPDGLPIFSSLSAEAFDQLREAHPTFFGSCIQRLNGLFNAGLFDDWPAGDIEPRKYEGVPIRPFSDEAFTEILRAAFFMSQIQQDLEACYAEISAIEVDEKGRKTIGRFVRPYRNQCIAKWSGEYLYPGLVFPYQFEVDGERKLTQRFSSWPLQTLSGVKSLLSLCQAANAIILNTATAGRVSEMQTLSRDPLIQFDGMEGLIGSTFKESEDPKGSTRHWPLPHQAVEAIWRQQRMLKVFGHKGKFLWVPGNRTTTGVVALEYLIPRFGVAVHTLDGTPLCDLDGTVSSHRFRKTMSRLAGLALEGASEVLYTVLGHSDIDITLGYMLSDREFRLDADKVRREVQDVRRKQIIAKSEECGGPAAETLRAAKSELLRKTHRLGVSADNPEVFRTILPYVEKVRDGVFCTSDSKQKGLCSKVTGNRDLGACSASCIFRLETAAAAQDRKRAVEQAIKMLCIDRLYAGARPFYQSQILANLAPFPKTIDAFANDNRLRLALKDCDPRHFDPLPQQVRDKLIAYIGAIT